MVALWHYSVMNKTDQGDSHGRTNQKARTRAALLASALELIRKGRQPTVEEAALAVGISKRTAYRYFLSQDHMLADAALDGLRGQMDKLLSAPTAADAHTRLSSLAAALRQLGESHEPELRTMMRAALDMSMKGQQQQQPAPARGGRRLDWIRTALEPVKDRFPPEGYSQLVNGLAVSIGIDALIVLRDICGLRSEEAEKVMIWASNALLNRALADVSENQWKRSADQQQIGLSPSMCDGT